MRLARRGLIAAILGLASIGAAPAQAYRISAMAEEDVYFTGVGCGAQDTQQLLLPRGAKSVKIIAPAAGDVVEGEFGGTVATVTAVERTREGNRRAVDVTVLGSDEACSPSSDYRTGWETDFLTIRARYTRDVRLYFTGNDTGIRYRPKTVYFGASQFIKRIRWASWGRSVAKGKGVYPVNDCIPYCAAGSYTDYPVLVRLSRPRFCNGHYQYLRMTRTYRGKRPTGSPKRMTVDFGSYCE